MSLYGKETAGDRKPVYWVILAIREREFDECDEPEQKEAHRKAYKWFDTQYEKDEHPPPEYSEEAVYHALACGNVRGACKHAVFVGGYKEQQLLYREKAEIQETVAQRITDEVIDEEIKEKDEYAAMLLTNIGETWRTLGEHQKAIGFFNKALAIFMDFFGPDHTNTKIVAGNIQSLKE